MVVIVARETAMKTELSADSQRPCIGLDVHREFAQVAIWQGGLVIQAGRFALVFRSFLALSPVRGSRGHADDVWVVDLGV
jgi:hypothetical protein